MTYIVTLKSLCRYRIRRESLCLFVWLAPLAYILVFISMISAKTFENQYKPDKTAESTGIQAVTKLILIIGYMFKSTYCYKCLSLLVGSYII
jgi:hypothetical protein